MLGKLLKYEFKATGRTFLPLYGTVLLFAIFGRFSLTNRVMEISDTTAQLQLGGGDFLGRLGDIMTTLMLTLYVLVILAAFVITIVIIIQRFWKNLMGDEGYLMFTLPVSTHQLLWSKAIVATVWYLLTSLVVLASVAVLLFQPWMLRQIGESMAQNQEEWTQLFAMFGTFFGQIGWFFLAAAPVSTLGSILCVYAAMAIGHTVRSHKVLASLGAYMGLGVLSSMISSTLLSVAMPFLYRDMQGFTSLTTPQEVEAFLGAMSHFLSLTMIFSMVLSVIVAAVMYFIAHYLLSTQLNLE